MGKPISLTRLIFACMVIGGVQYGWALQLALLTPYVQTLGISHALSSLMWLFGPIAGFVLQPLVGLWSDKCQSKLGRRRPFIFAGCILICTAVTIIGFSSDIGFALGDTKESCSTYNGPRWAAALVYVFGFWILDFSNNTLQGPTRAMMADLSAQHGWSTANAIFSSWMACGNILGYISGASGAWHRWFPFLMTPSCCEACANLKGAFLVAVVFLLICMSVTMVCAQEETFSKDKAGAEGRRSGLADIFRSLKNLPPGMAAVMAVTAMTWIAWFPFFLYNTDWMGREIYHGDPMGTDAEMRAYDVGVRDGAFGLLLNSIVLGISSFLISSLCRKLTARVVWVIGNFVVCICLVGMSVLSYVSMNGYEATSQGLVGPVPKIRAAALAIYIVIGFPLAILLSVPFAVAAQLAATRGGGQGLCIGVLNIAIVVPQVIVALGAGPWDSIFGKGNIPAFALGGVFAFIGGFLGLILLPKLSKSTNH